MNTRIVTTHTDLSRTPRLFQVSNTLDGTLPLGRFCGNTFPAAPLRSDSSSMFVTFRSDAQNNYNGFAATFSACEFNISSFCCLLTDEQDLGSRSKRCWFFVEGLLFVCMRGCVGCQCDKSSNKISLAMSSDKANNSP